MWLINIKWRVYSHHRKINIFPHFYRHKSWSISPLLLKGWNISTLSAEPQVMKAKSSSIYTSSMEENSHSHHSMKNKIKILVSPPLSKALRYLKVISSFWQRMMKWRRGRYHYTTVIWFMNACFIVSRAISYIGLWSVFFHSGRRPVTAGIQRKRFFLCVLFTLQ